MIAVRALRDYIPYFVALTVLRLELEELSGAGAMDTDEEIVMEMFVKSMFIGSQASVPVDVDVEDEVEMSEVSSGVGELPSLPHSHSPTSSGSTMPGTMVSSSSSEGSTTALPVHDTLREPSLLDETSFESVSQSPSSSLPSWTTGSASSGHQSPSTKSTESTSLSGSVQDVGQSQRREEKQQRVLGQAFAMTDPPLSLASASAVSTASTVSSSASAKAGGSYFSPPTLTTNTPSPSSSYITTSSSSASTPSVSTPTPSSNQSQDQRSENERKSREAASFLLSYSNYQVDVVGKLTALQFLVEHQLATMPRLECFWLGGKMFQVPKRRSASSPLSSV
ncbi:hypothetical protein KI688_007885 [Linnemannia hyalina]|uniref:Uncharacterized protein n=1 Tax=Linnemannia hyalina TaxID=64524 RepID=A0A9P7XIV9_9FUNG|nr:hypothetical protein KI688_007885 [Linnemannia hyalina]